KSPTVYPDSLVPGAAAVTGTTLRSPENTPRGAPSRYRPDMAIKESREIVIEASPGEILDVIADLESLTKWSSAHQSSEVVETGDNGRRSVARMKVKSGG